MADSKYSYADYASPVYQNWKDWRDQVKGSMSAKDWYRYGEQAYGDWTKNINKLKKETVPELSTFATGPYGAFGNDFTDWSKAGTFEDFWKNQPAGTYSDFQKAAWIPKNRAAAQSIYDYSKWMYGAPTDKVDWSVSPTDIATTLGVSPAAGAWDESKAAGVKEALAKYFANAQGTGTFEDTPISKLMRAAAVNQDVFNQMGGYLFGGANPGAPTPPAPNPQGTVSDQPYLFDPVTKNFVYGNPLGNGKYSYVQANNPNFV